MRSVEAVVALVIIAVVLLTGNGFAETGSWSFDTDPGLTVDSGGGSDPNFGFSIADSIATVTMTREAVPQRVSMPLTGGPYGSADVFRIRTRFKALTSDAQIILGFLDSSAPNSESLTDNLVVIEWGAGNASTGTVGSDRERPSFSHQLNTWYITELIADFSTGEWTIEIFDGDTKSSLAATPPRSVGTLESDTLDTFGFGNEDCCQDADRTQVYEIDWVTFAVNEDLPADPASYEEPPDPNAPGAIECKQYSGVNFVIDGNLSEWPAESKVLQNVSTAYVGNHQLGDPDVVYNLYTAWDNDYIYLAYEVTSDTGDPAGLDSDSVSTIWYDDLCVLYLETLKDGGFSASPNIDVFSIDFRDSLTEPVNDTRVSLWRWNGTSDMGYQSAELNGSGNGTAISTVNSDGDTAYIWETRVAWADIAQYDTADTDIDLGTLPPVAGTTWTYDVLSIDNGWNGQGQFTIFNLHEPASWKDFTFLVDRPQESGSWSFDTDPGLIVDNGGGSDPNFGFEIADGIATVTMTREAVPQRVYMELENGPYGEMDSFRIRARYQALTADAAIILGFLDSNEPNSSANTNNLIDLEWGAGNTVTGQVGSDRERPTFSHQLDTWYIAELNADFQTGEWTLALFDGDTGASLASLGPRAVGSLDSSTLDIFGFGNEDCCADTDRVQAYRVDWVTYAVNTSLPMDPQDKTAVYDWNIYR